MSTELNLAETNRGGEVVTVNNSDRIFDSLTLTNGSTILFEGIDRIIFRDGEINPNSLAVSPNDPDYVAQWNLHAIGVHNAWRFTTGTEDVLVNVQDSGLGVTRNQIHPDLRIDYYNRDNYADDFFNNNRGASFGLRDDSHGTSVQGIIAASSNNGEGIAGINWGSAISQVDVNIHNNPNDIGFFEATEAAIEVADRENQKLVINLSIANSSFNTSLFDANNAEFNRLILSNPDVLFVIASGNNGNLGEEGLASPGILARYYDNVVAVGASWGDRDVAGNPVPPGTRIEYPRSWGSQYGQGLTVTAPSEVLTTEAFANGNFSYDPTFNGTSAAAPHVSGVASLVWSANPDLTAFEVKDIIAETAFDLGTEGYDVEYGYGLVNADAAVRRAIALGRETGNSFDREFDNRLREMLDYFQERFPNTNIDGIYDTYGLTANSFTPATSSSSVDPLTGTGSNDNFDEWQTDNITNQTGSNLIPELNDYYFGTNNLEVASDREPDSFEAIANNDNVTDLWEFSEDV